jgi:alginate O-acetyltransferase complex protein AlgI
MSLSFWLRDYLFIPLGGSRHGKFAYYRNLLTTMILGGLWHGAAWTFVAWGLLHGLALVVHKVWTTYLKVPVTSLVRLPSLLGWLVGFALTQGVVLAGWAIFRANSTADALSALGALSGLRDSGPQTLSLMALLVIGVLALDHILGVRRWRPNWRVMDRPELWWAGAGAAIALALSIYPLTAAPFVYFQF